MSRALLALLAAAALLYSLSWLKRSRVSAPPLSAGQAQLSQHDSSAARPAPSSVTKGPRAQRSGALLNTGSQADQAPLVHPSQALTQALSDPSYGLERLEGDSALEKEPKRPLNAALKTLSPSPRDASWRAGQALSLGWHETALPEGEGRARVKLSLSAESAEGHRVAAALRPRVLKSLYFLLAHRASGALTLPDAEQRLARDLNERLARMSAGYALEAHVEGLEVHFE